MQILDALKRLRDDIKLWATNNFNALNAKIDEKTIPIDSKLSTTSTNPVQNKTITNAINNIPRFSGSYNDLTDAPNISEDDSDNMVIADESGNIIFKADADGIHTTAVSLNGEAAATEKYVDEAIATKVDFTGYATEEQLDNLRKEIGEGIESDAEDWKIVDEAGNIIFRVDKDGAHTTSMTLDGKEVATKEYVEGIIPEVDLTGYATEEYVDDAVASIPTPDVSGQINAHNVNGESHADIRQAIEDTKEELSESIVAESDEWKVVDNNGNIIFSVNAEGAHTTELILNGETAATEVYVDNAIANINIPEVDFTGYATEKYVDDAIAAIPETDFTGYATEDFVGTAINTAKEELSESIVAESNEWKVVDEAGNIIFSVDATGAHTTELTLNGESAATESYVDNAIENIEFPTTDLTDYATKKYVDDAVDGIETPSLDGYATETYVDNKVADLVNSAPEALNTLGELATALENHEDAYDALLETVGNKATHTDLENLKEELSESIVAEADEWKVVDEAGNIIFSVDASGAHTTALTLDGQSVEDIINDIATPDWNQNDETQPDYVKNRTHYARDIDFTYNGPYDFIKVDGIAPDSRLVSTATLGTLNSNVEPTNYSMIGLFGNNYTGVKFGEIVKNTPNGPSLYFCIIATYIGTGYTLRLYTSSESGLYGATPTITDVKHVTKLSAMYLPDDVLSAASAIPSVNSSNNGQFLRVVDGVWTAATVPNAEEANF